MSRPGPRRTRAIALLAAVVAILGACGGGASAGATGTPTVAPTATASSPASPDPSPSAAPSGASTVAIDPDLLDLLPAEVDGAPFVEAPEAEGTATSDAGLARVASRLAVGYVAPEGSTEWAIVSVVALRPIPFTAEQERSWRDSYDTEACSDQGGPAGHAETQLGGRTVHVTTCGGFVIHHVRIASPALLVAVTSTAGARYGERIVANLRP